MRRGTKYIYIYIHNKNNTIKTVTKSYFTIKLDNYRGNRITKKISYITIRID